MAPRGLLALAALMIPVLPLGLILWPTSKASPATDHLLWGTPAVVPCENGRTGAVLATFADPPRLTIRGAGGPIDSVKIASPEKDRTSTRATLCLDVPLQNPNLLGANGADLTLNYHTEGRRNWAKTRIDMQANDTGPLYDWMGGREAAGELNLRLDRSAILSRSGVSIRIEIMGLAIGDGAITLSLDSISLAEG